MNSPLSPEAPTVVAIPFSGAAHILLVDDDESVLLLEAANLRRAGYSVETAGDGASAWHALLTGTFDLLVTDHLMPGISGVALVRQLRVVGMALPVVLVSGTMEILNPEHLRRDPRTRIHAFVCKPFLIVDFLEAVASALAVGSRQLLRA